MTSGRFVFKNSKISEIEKQTLVSSFENVSDKQFIILELKVFLHTIKQILSMSH